MHNNFCWKPGVFHHRFTTKSVCLNARCHSYQQLHLWIRLTKCWYKILRVNYEIDYLVVYFANGEIFKIISFLSDDLETLNQYQLIERGIEPPRLAPRTIPSRIQPSTFASALPVPRALEQIQRVAQSLAAAVANNQPSTSSNVCSSSYATKAIEKSSSRSSNDPAVQQASMVDQRRVPTELQREVESENQRISPAHRPAEGIFN